MEQLFFYIFAFIAVAAAIAVITVKNPIHSAVFLIVCLIQVAALYVLLKIPFLAAVQIFIYVGAVMVLFLFAVMIIDIGKERLKEQIHSQKKYAIPAVILFFMATGYMVLRGKLTVPAPNDPTSLPGFHIEGIGKFLYTKYIFPFELVSVLLLVALVGAIVLVMKDKKGTRSKDHSIDEKS